MNTQIIKFDDILNIKDLKSIYCNASLGVKFRDHKNFVSSDDIAKYDGINYYKIGRINDILIFVDPYKSMMDFRIHTNKPTHEYDVTENPYLVDITIEEII